MTAEVTDELSRVDGTAVCCRRAEVATLLRFCEALHIGAGRVVVIAEVETGSVARRLRQGITGLYGYPCAVQVLPPLGRRSGGRYVVQVIADGEALSRRTGLLDRGGRPVRGPPVPVVAGGACDAAAVWRGAFLVQALSEPGRSPALEAGGAPRRPLPTRPAGPGSVRGQGSVCGQSLGRPVGLGMTGSEHLDKLFDRPAALQDEHTSALRPSGDSQGSLGS